MKKLFVGLLAVAGAWCAKAQDSVAYLEPVFDAHGAVTNYVTAFVPADGYTLWQNRNMSDVALAEGWHVIAGNCTIDKNASLATMGDVKLILKDYASLKKAKSDKRRGFIVQTGSLTVYAQSTDENTMGKMEISGGDYCAAIGSVEDGYPNAPITINGGIVTATGGSYAAGIGGGNGGPGVDIAVNGGVVTATGGSGAAGIGGGVDAVGRHITVRGGDVTATGGSHAAGIGGGDDGAGEDILIADGTVRAEGRGTSAIGGGLDGASTNIVICGGSVSVVMQDDFRSAFAPVDAESNRVYEVVVSDVFNGADGRVKLTGLENYGCASLIAHDGRLSLWLPNGNYEFFVGDRRCFAHVNDAATQAFFDGDLPPISYRAPVLDVTGVLTGFVKAVCSDYTPVQAAGGALHFDSGWYVVVGTNVAWQGVEVVGDVKLILTDGSSLRSWPTNATGQAGVHIGTNGKLTVYAQSSDETKMGELIAIGGANGAGIGGNEGEDGHDISINGGKVTAWGTLGSAGIGGGSGGDGYNLVISGGRIQALTLGTGAGIGGGNGGCGHEILVRGGTVSFSKDAASSHLGSGHGGAAPSGLYIGGGSVLTMTNKVGGVVRDRQLNAVYPAAVKGLADGPATVTGLPNYGTYDLTVVDGELMLWLPAGTHTFTVNGEAREVTVKGQGESAHDPVLYRVPTIVSDQVSGYSSATCTTYGVIDTFTAAQQLLPGWYVASGKLNSDRPLAFSGDTHLILRDGAELTVAGVTVAAGGSLTVYAQSADANTVGKLVSAGADNVAGLGGGSCTVTINGGEITATGGGGAAGIGSCGNAASGAAVVLNGGIVQAFGGASASGIGPGQNAARGSVKIRAGRVTATRGSGASADIGGDVSILDGTVSASAIGESGAAVSISGGTVRADTVQNSAIFRVTLVGGWAEGEKIAVSGVGSYAADYVYAMNGSVYLWLPNGSYVITAKNLTASVTVNGAPVEKKDRIAYLEPVFDKDGATTNFVERQITDYTYHGDENLSGKQLSAGWHVIAGNCTIDKNASLSTGGDVKLILADDASLKKGKDGQHHGFIVQTGSLTVYAQTTDENTMGKMEISGGDYCAAIGTGDPDDGHDNKPITINGGKITATGGNYAAGIGTSKKGNASHITINGGIVTATGGKYGAGIGGGERSGDQGGYASNITINGGKVTATGGAKAAGIGGGRYGKGHDIFINGGEVWASCPDHAAGIGGGDNSDGYNIFIRGGFVSAICYDNGAAGIGAGGDGKGGCGHDITISGGTVFAQGDENGDSIGSANGGGDPYNIVFTGGSIVTNSNNKVGDFCPKNGKEQKVYEVTVAEVEGLCTVTGLGDYGTKDLKTYHDKLLHLWLPNGTYSFIVNGQKRHEATVNNGPTKAQAVVEGGVPYLAYDEAKDTFSLAEASNCCLVTSADTAWGKDGATTWYVADGNVTIGNTVNVMGHVNLILKDNCLLKVNGGRADASTKRGAAIRRVGKNGSFTVYAQTSVRNVMGELVATGADFGAGIGGGNPDGAYDVYDQYGYFMRTIESGHDEYGRNITVNGGAVTANGGLGAAGIGGAQDYAGENIRINGGSVTANGGQRGGAGIGGGGSDTDLDGYTWGDARDIFITGGLVTARGGAMDVAENEGRSSFDSWFTTVYECWGRATDIGGGGSYTKEEARNNTPGLMLLSLVPYVGSVVTVSLWVADTIMQYTDEYSGGGDSDNIRISGGTVDALLVGGEYTKNFFVTGGSVLASLMTAAPRGESGKELYMVALRLSDAEAASLVVPSYGTRDIIPMRSDGYVCLWLPTGYQEIKMDGKRYALVVNGAEEYSLSELGEDLNVTVDGVKVVDDMVLKCCSYSSSDHTLRITGPLDHPYVLSGSEDKGRVKLVVENGADLVFSNLLLTAGSASEPQSSPVTFASGTSRVELKGETSNYFGSHYTQDGKPVLAQGCGIVVASGAYVSFFGDGSLTAVAGGGAAAIGGRANELCGGITIEGGRIRVCGGTNAARIGSGDGAGPGESMSATAGPIVVSGGWISALDGVAYSDLGCGEYDEKDHFGKYVNVPVTVTGGTLDLTCIRGTTRSMAPSLSPEALIWWWVTNAHVVVDGGVFKGLVGHGEGTVSYAHNSRGEQVWSNHATPCYTGTSADEVITNLVVSTGVYGMHDACAIDGYLYLWLPTNATLGVNHPDGVRNMTGFQVSGRDIAWGEGDGWRYDPSASLLTLDEYLYYRLHEDDQGRTRDLCIAAVTNVTVTLDGVCLRSTGGAPLEVAAGRSLSIGVLVSNALVSATANAPGIDLKAGATVFVKKYDDPSAPEGPVLEVVGGANAPGIGTMANADTGIHIDGATVRTTGGSGAAGLGNGAAGGRMPTVKIVGGCVIADRIGRGTSGGTGGGIVVEGGSVETDVLGTTKGDANPAPITIIGGSVAAKTWCPQPVEASGLMNVHDTRIGYPWVGPAKIEGLGDYGTNDLYPAADGNLHVWLPASYDTTTIIVDDFETVPLEVLTSQAGGRAFTSVNATNISTSYTKAVAELVAANALVARPNEDVEKVVGPLIYGSYFKVTPQPTGVGANYTLDVDLTEETRRKIYEDIEDALPALVETVTNAVPTTTVKTLAGLYYGIAGATNVVDMTAAEVPDGETKLGAGDPLELKGKRPEDVTDRAFYSIRASARP